MSDCQTIASSTTETMQFTSFRLSAADDDNTESTFKQREVTIGSHPDCDFCIRNASVSRHHATISFTADGCKLIDNGSKNGTFVNGVKIVEIYLASAIAFQCGNVIVRFTPTSEVVELALSKNNHFGNLLGESMKMREIFALLERIAPTPATVLIEGESGTGKELVAEAIHMHSDRADKPFVVFDCSAVSKELIESELFGHVKGSFTGAVNTRKGAFLQADGGTIFLDEIGELEADLQPKLLRVLEKQEIRPVGSEKVYKLDIRVVAATNRSLKREVEAGNFREDLFYRLAVLHVHLPPLRNRAEDIPLLVDAFIEKTAKRFNRPKLYIGYQTLRKLQKYSWPGNVRELKNYVERAALLSTDDRLETKFISQNENFSSETQSSPDEMLDKAIEEQMPFKEAKQRLVENFEKQYWLRLLKITSGNISQAARIAGVHRKSVEYIMNKLELERPE